MKDLIVELIDSFNKGYHSKSSGIHLSFRSVVLNSNYFVPDVHFSTKGALASRKIEDALFCEIWSQERCIFRQYTPIGHRNIQEVEEKTLQKLIESLFAHAIVGANSTLEVNEMM